MDKIKQWLYYAIIGVISFISLVFLPMVGSTVGLSWNVPDTVVGWIVWVAVKLIVSTINILVFYCFMCQAKVNVKDNPNYKEAREILFKQKNKEVLPKSPKKWNTEQYLRKGTTIFITSALSTIALTQAVLAFDYISMLSYLFTIVMGLIFGIIQMKTAEEYWTTEYLEYAKMRQNEELNLIEQEKSLNKEKLNDNSEWSNPQESGGTSSEESEGHSGLPGGEQDNS